MNREEERMEGDTTPASGDGIPDFRGVTSLGSSSDAKTELASDRPSRLVLDIARLIGRQLAREDYQRRAGANNNRSPAAGGDGA